jgi:predicted ribosomally synthesized peptide with nif11-like leader
MPLTKVEEFLNNVGEDQALQAELANALEAENDREAVTALAKSKGYDFSSEELWAAIQKRQAEFSQKEAAGELSDEELEAVAGGVTPAAAGLAFGAAGVSYAITKDIGSKIKW